MNKKIQTRYNPQHTLHHMKNLNVLKVQRIVKKQEPASMT